MAIGADGREELELVVRAARAGDAEQLVDWNLRLAQESEGLVLARARLARGVAAALADTQRGRYLIAERRRAGVAEAVGGLLVTREWSDWRDGWWWWIQSVYVEPEARRQGVYDALHARVASDARAAGDVVGVRLYVEHANTRAQRTYRRVGMVDSGYLLFEQPL